MKNPTRRKFGKGWGARKTSTYPSGILAALVAYF